MSTGHHKHDACVCGNTAGLHCTCYGMHCSHDMMPLGMLFSSYNVIGRSVLEKTLKPKQVAGHWPLELAQ